MADNSCPDAIAYTQQHAQPGYAYTTDHQQQTSGTNPPPLGKPLPTLNPASLAKQNLNNRESPSRHQPPPEANRSFVGQTLVGNRPPWIEPDSPQKLRSLFETPICCRQKPSGSPPPPRGGFMEKHPPALSKANPQRQPSPPVGRALPGIVLFAKTPQAASKLWQTGTHPEFKNLPSAGEDVHSTTPTEILTPIGLVPHPSSVRVGPPTQVANRQSHCESDLAHTGTTTFE